MCTILPSPVKVKYKKPQLVVIEIDRCIWYQVLLIYAINSDKVIEKRRYAL